MSEYIDRDAFLAEQRKLYCEKCERRKGMKKGKIRFVYDIGDAPCRACGIEDVLSEVESFPEADVVPRDAYNQLHWERDVMAGQLADVGKTLGQKMDDVVPVIRCKDCAYYDFDETYNKHWCNRTYGCTEVKPDHFCSYGKGRT